MLKLLRVVMLVSAATLAAVIAHVIYYPDPQQEHLSRVLNLWGWPLVHDYDMRTAAEAALTYGCQTAGLYPSHGYDYYDYLHSRFLNRPEWLAKRDVWVSVNEVGRPYVARLGPEQRTALCQEIRLRASSAGY